MAGTASDWAWIEDEVRTAARGFAQQVRSIGDVSTKVPNLEWDVGELAAHLVSLPRLNREQNESPVFERPDDFTEFSRRMRDHVHERDADALADRLVVEFDEFVTELAADPSAHRWMYGQPTDGFRTAAGMLTELKLHGMDLAALTGVDIEWTRRHALASIEQSMTLAPVFLDRDRARKFDGVYGLRFRGGGSYTYRIDGGVLTVEQEWPERADARMRADPVAFTLLALGRMSPLKAGLLGKVVVYGRAPWKLARMNTAVVDGV